MCKGAIAPWDAAARPVLQLCCGYAFEYSPVLVQETNDAGSPVLVVSALIQLASLCDLPRVVVSPDWIHLPEACALVFPALFCDATPPGRLDGAVDVIIGGVYAQFMKFVGGKVV